MEQAGWDVYYVASVLAELVSRERGYEVKLTLTPKEEPMSPQQEEGG